MLMNCDLDCMYVHICVSQGVFTNIHVRKISILSVVNQASLQKGL